MHRLLRARISVLVGLALGLGVALVTSGCPRPEQRRKPDRGTSQRMARAAGPLVVREINFAGPAGLRSDASFMPGEVVTCLLSVSGFHHDQGKVNLRTDLKVTGPDGQIILDQPDLELLRGATSSPRPGTIRSAAQLRISRAAPPGRHTLTIRVRDLLGGGSGVGHGEFTLLGTPEEAEEHLQLSELHWAAGGEAPAGAVLPAVFLLKGITTRKLAARGHQLDLQVRSRIAGGATYAQREEALFRGSLSFAPDAYPFEHQIALPADAAPGDYQAIIDVTDKISDVRVSGRLPLKVVPPRFGIWNIHLRDASGLTRESFVLGEQTFVRFAVFGLNSRAQQLDAVVDLAIAGPDGGVYLARPRAVTSSGATSRAFARAGRLPAQLPLLLPALAPTGRYRVVVRAHDQLVHKETVAEATFDLRGSAPPPLSEFAVTDLQVRDRPDLPPGKGDTFIGGHSYELNLVLGGVQPKEVRKLTYSVSVEGNLQLRNLAGAVVHERKGLFNYRRQLSYKPLRLQVPASWRAPELPPGLYDLEVTVLDQLSDRTSQLRRRVELVRLAPLRAPAASH